MLKFLQKSATHFFLKTLDYQVAELLGRLDRKHLCTNLSIITEFLLILDTVNKPEGKCNQAEQEGCFKECLHRNTSRHATCVLRGVYLRKNVST